MCYCSLQTDGSSALTRAANGGHTEVVQALLETFGVNVNHADVSIYLLIRCGCWGRE